MLAPDGRASADARGPRHRPGAQVSGCVSGCRGLILIPRTTSAAAKPPLTWGLTEATPPSVQFSGFPVARRH